MANVTIECPQCKGTGLIGTAVESICPQCAGKGILSADDSQTLNTINASSTFTAANKFTLTCGSTARAVPLPAVRVAGRGRV